MYLSLNPALHGGLGCGICAWFDGNCRMAAVVTPRGKGSGVDPAKAARNAPRCGWGGARIGRRPRCWARGPHSGRGGRPRGDRSWLPIRGLTGTPGSCRKQHLRRGSGLALSRARGTQKHWRFFGRNRTGRLPRGRGHCAGAEASGCVHPGNHEHRPAFGDRGREGVRRVAGGPSNRWTRQRRGLAPCGHAHTPAQEQSSEPPPRHSGPHVPIPRQATHPCPLAGPILYLIRRKAVGRFSGSPRFQGLTHIKPPASPNLHREGSTRTLSPPPLSRWLASTLACSACARPRR